MKIQIFLIILIISFNLSLLSYAKRSYSQAYSSSYASSSQAYASAYSSASAGSSVASSASRVGTSSSTSANTGSPQNQSSSSSSSSSSSTNKDGKTKYKIETSVKTNNDPEIRTKIQSDDINKQPKREIKIGDKRIDESKLFKNNTERKLHKLSVYFIRSLLKTMGFKSKIVKKCTKNLNTDKVRKSFNVIYNIGKHKKGYQKLNALKELCTELKDIKRKLNDTSILEKVIIFINNNM